MYLSTILAMFLAPFALADDCVGDKTIVGHCETLTYTDITLSSPNPPLVSECYDTCRGVLSDAGDWGVEFNGKPDGYRQNMLLYPCGFSMGRAPGAPQNYSFDMHNQDIIDIIDEATQRFAPLHGGRVAAEGLVRCDGFEGQWRID